MLEYLCCRSCNMGIGSKRYMWSISVVNFTVAEPIVKIAIIHS